MMRRTPKLHRYAGAQAQGVAAEATRSESPKPSAPEPRSSRRQENQVPEAERHEGNELSRASPPTCRGRRQESLAPSFQSARTRYLVSYKTVHWQAPSRKDPELNGASSRRLLRFKGTRRDRRSGRSLHEPLRNLLRAASAETCATLHWQALTNQSAIANRQSAIE